MYRSFILLFASLLMSSQSMLLAAEQKPLVDYTISYAQLKIKSYKYWDVYLHENQCYIGRVFALLKDDSQVSDILELPEEALIELYKIGKDIKATLKKLFQPDMINYAALGNTCSRVHVHFVPRYSTPREFQGMVFQDARWGLNYAPYDRSFILSELVQFRIRDALSGCLNRCD